MSAIKKKVEAIAMQKEVFDSWYEMANEENLLKGIEPVNPTDPKTFLRAMKGIHYNYLKQEGIDFGGAK